MPVWVVEEAPVRLWWRLCVRVKVLEAHVLVDGMMVGRSKANCKGKGSGGEERGGKGEEVWAWLLLLACLPASIG